LHKFFIPTLTPGVGSSGLKMPNGVDEIADGLKVGPKPAVKQNEQQDKKRYNYKVFQSAVC